MTGYIPIDKYDLIYSSKVFTFTREDAYLPDFAIKGGSGYHKHDNLPSEGEYICSDYTGLDFSLGFLTRGCIRNCSWCIVPKKEGAYMLL